ncbi:SusD/RagB family nutrient-binding outer membrane lipoprotein [Pararcticibacter amylolyticus]|uniref:SusD/RagB family nutrient-binding outer membrane lipoprotein n=1 Tax=Pararcticibacter amylolyticus TaxID=2173175 RepID=A0A2U2PJG5_9SPHI|nr:SusD/RagB family nutrient-binding outer membrane lipoprotein [Pararcticibacter amylolyticus]PWG81547.1 SusD/RagB family nutrient-binding outer membrane lipoprotein [Pararcticibacter amylolyticus]
MKKVFIILLGVLVIQSGCKKFSEFQVDPNKTTIATPDLLLNSIEQSAFQSSDITAAIACRQMIYSDAVNLSQYYGWSRAGFGAYNNLRLVLKMEQAATAQNKPEYIPLARFFRAWFFLQLTQTFGDIPYSQALKGDEGLGTPVYDNQEDIYLDILNELKEANGEITSGTTAVKGDIVYNGNMRQWKQAINALSLRVLMSLSLKENDNEINVKKRFAEIVSSPSDYPLFTGNGDNAALKFYDLQGNRYPYFNNNDMQTTNYMEETFVDLLKSLKDVRLFSFADKAPKFASLPVTDFNAYGGTRGSAAVNENKTRVLAGEVSKINPRFYTNPTNEPSIALGYAEQQFILAEGVVRGWITGNASDYYEKGIGASMSFYKIDQAAIDTYLAQNTVKLSTGNPIQQIITQKYIASFFNSGWQPFYEQRRTGFPVFDVSGSGMLNDKKIPKRWMYPETELQRNQQHVTEAISRQYPDGDNINAVMWLIKP